MSRRRRVLRRLRRILWGGRVLLGALLLGVWLLDDRSWWVFVAGLVGLLVGAWEQCYEDEVRAVR